MNEPQNYGAEEYQITPEEIQLLLENIDVTIFPTEVMDKEEIKLKEITDQILEDYKVVFGGLSDPIGQLQSWLADTLSGFSNWIVSSISSLIDGFYNSIVNTFNAGWQQITSTFQEYVVTPLTDVINQASSYLTETLPNQLDQALNNFTQTISGALSNLQNIIGNISSGLEGLVNQVNNIASSILSSLQQIPSTIENMLTQISTSFEGMTKQIGGIIEGAMKSIDQAFSSVQGIFKQITDVFEEFYKQASSGFETILKSIQSIPDTLQGLFKQITDRLEGIPKAIQEIINNIQPTLETIFDQITSSLQGIPDTISKLLDQVSDAVSQIPSTIQDYLGKLGDSFNQLIGDMGKTVTNIIDTLKDFPTYVMGAIEDVRKWVWEQLPKELKEFLSTAPKFIAGIGDMWNNFINAVLSFPEWFPKWFYEHISKPISDAIQGFSKWIWDNTPKEIKGFFTWIQDEFWKGWNNFIGFLNWLKEESWKQITDMIESATKTFNWIREELPDRIKKGIDGIVNVADGIASWIENKTWETTNESLKTLSDAVSPIFQIIAKPDEFMTTLTNYTTSGLNWLGKHLTEFGKWIVGRLGDLWNTITSLLFKGKGNLFEFSKGMLKSMASKFGEVLSGAFPFFVDISKSLLTPIYNFFIVGQMKTISEKVWEGFRKQIKWEEILSKGKLPSLKGGELVYIFSLMGVPLLTLFGCRILSRYMYGLANLPFFKTHVKIEPEGMGTKIGGVTIPIRLDWTIKELAGVIGRLPKMTFNYTLEYLIYWYAQLYTKPLSATLRDFIPIEIPRTDDLIEMLRRAMYVVEEDEKSWQGYKKMIRNILALQGYSTPFVVNLTADINEPVLYNPSYGETFTITMNRIKNYIEYIDRFNKKRKMPISLLYKIPDIPTLALFLLRDIFPDIDTFKKLALSRGVYEDTAYLYYLARFKYPTPERLYEFYARAEANMLWYKPPKDLKTKAEQEAKGVGAFTPVAPIQLNVTSSDIGKKIVSAITQYMKWHDYALFSWVEGFTSDAWLWLDLMAQIPLRIDARWMYKWMTFSSMYPQIDKAREVKEVPLDEYNLGRIIIGRRTHPDFVPYVTIAECMNALTEERTFFRTGILNAFRYNIMDIDTVKKIFAGMFKLTLHAPVYDHENHIYKWKRFTIPVRFLEGESKLMTLRAIYDRASRTYRDIQRTIFMMVTQNYDNPEKYSDYLKKLAEGINKVTIQIAKKFGLEAGFTILFDESYADILNTSAKMRHSYNLMMRLRRWLWYSLYQLWYRFQRGMVSDKELEQFVDQLVKTMKLTKEEKEFFIEVAKFFRDIYRKEYRKKVIITYLKKGRLSKEKAIEELVKLGIDKETANDIIESEAKIYVPTVSTLTTLAEVVPEALQLLDKVMEAQGIPEEERPLWKKYAILKPLKDEASKLVTELIYDYAKGIISQMEFKSYLEEMKTFGYSDEEIDLLMKLAELRRRRYVKK